MSISNIEYIYASGKNFLDEKYYNKKNKILDDFLTLHASTPIQGSADWATIRKTTIGGSEIATILGLNPFSSRAKLLAEKMGLEHFYGNINTRWGKLFEEESRRWTEIVLEIKQPIRETGSLPGIIDRQRYSPDGLGIVALNCEIGELATREYFIILFEFKSPIRSLPGGNVPEYYRPQIQTGLLNIPIADYAIFVNNCYRKCALGDLNFNFTYDEEFHNGKMKNNYRVLAIGMIVFNSNMPRTTNHTDAVNHTDLVNQLMDFTDVMYDKYILSANPKFNLSQSTNLASCIDFGSQDGNALNDILISVEKGQTTVKYLNMQINMHTAQEINFLVLHDKCRMTDEMRNMPIDEMENVAIARITAELNAEIAKGQCIGFLPWKLFASDIILEKREADWLEKIKGPVLDTLREMDEIRNEKNKYYENYTDTTNEIAIDELEQYKNLLK